MEDCYSDDDERDDDDDDDSDKEDGIGNSEGSFLQDYDQLLSNDR